MPSVVQLVSDTSGGNWRDYRHGFALPATRADQSDLSANTHHEIWRFRAPAEWIANNQRAVVIGHACYWARNFTGRRAWNVWVTGGISTSGNAGVSGCSYEMTPTSTFPASNSGSERLLGIDFQIDVRFTLNTDTVVSIRTNDTGTMRFKNFNDSQSILWVVPTDERDV